MKKKRLEIFNVGMHVQVNSSTKFMQTNISSVDKSFDWRMTLPVGSRKVLTLIVEWWHAFVLCSAQVLDGIHWDYSYFI